MPEEKVGALNLSKIRELIAALVVLAADPNVQQLIAFVLSLINQNKITGPDCPPDCPCPDHYDEDEIKKIVAEEMAKAA